MDQHTDARTHSIISYLQRPQLIDTFEFDSSVGRNGILGKVDKTSYIIPDVLLNPMYIDKLDGFTSFRATAVFKLQLNAQPFQCGRLCMFAVPMPTLVGHRNEWIMKHITLAQSVHNVQLDIAKQTEVELRIPFVSPFNSYDLIHSQFPWSALTIMVYSPLNQVENPKPGLECLLWAHFEDIQLGAPTSGKSGFKKYAVQQSNTVSPQPKAGRPAPKEAPQSLVEATRKVEGMGFINKIGGAAQNAYKTLGSAAPFLRPVTDTLSVLSKIGTGLVGSIFSVLPGLGGLFGFSKPVLHTSGSTVVVRPQQFFTNANGNDHSHVLSLDVLNTIDEYPGLGGTTCAETSLEFLKKIPQYVASFKYSNQSCYNATLAKWMVTPSYDVPATFKYQTGDNQLMPTQPTILKYITSPFVYWTGSLVYTLRFVKTDYHSGRVEISFHPFVSGVDKSRMDYVYRLVVDLREKSEVSFVVPYISPQPWKLTKRKEIGAVQPYEYDPMNCTLSWADVGSNSTGCILVRALTPLLCASPIVSKEIEVLIEVRAGDDFKVQCPTRTNDYLPFSFDDSLTFATQQSGRVVAVPGQQETRTSSVEGFIPPSITGEDADINRVDTQHLCAGEEFSDYLSLAKRFYWTNRFQLLHPQDVQHISFDDVVSLPEMRRARMLDDGSPAKEIYRLKTRALVCPLTYISSMYAFYRGSYRIKLYSPDENVFVSAQLGYRGDINTYSGPKNTVNYFGAEAFEQMNVKRIAEVQVPYYAPTVMTAHNNVYTDTVAFTTPQIFTRISGNSARISEKPQTIFMAVAAGDDFGLHSFIGIPPTFRVSYYRQRASADQKAPPLFDPKVVDVDPMFPLDIPYNDDTGKWHEVTDIGILPEEISLVDRVFTWCGQNPCPPPKTTAQASPVTWSYTYKSAV